MYGAILGDIIGSPFEFDRGDKTKNFDLFSEGCGFTDDSVMTIAVGEALLAVGPEAAVKEIEDAVASNMQDWGKRYPHAGYGGCFRHWLKENNPKPYGSYAYLLNGRFINAALTQQLFLRFFPDTPFPVLPSVVVCHSYFLQSELIERAEKSPLIFPKEKTRGLNALNFNFLLSFLVFLGFWLCVCSQRSGLCPTSPRLHARKVRQKRLPVSAPVHYPTAKAGRLSACPP